MVAGHTMHWALVFYTVTYSTSKPYYVTVPWCNAMCGSTIVWYGAAIWFGATACSNWSALVSRFARPFIRGGTLPWCGARWGDTVTLCFLFHLGVIIISIIIMVFQLGCVLSTNGGLCLRQWAVWFFSMRAFNYWRYHGVSRVKWMHMNKAVSSWRWTDKKRV